jgi:hypothetical protein
MKVIAYEHKVSLIRQLPLSTVSNALVVHGMYKSETDKWLKKLLALRLLEFERIEEIQADKEDLIHASKCQIDL